MGMHGWIVDWVYKMKPRHPFSRIGKPDGVHLERGHDLDVSLFYELHRKTPIKKGKQLSDEEKKKLLKKLHQFRKIEVRNQILAIFIAILIFIMLVLLVLLAPNNYPD